MRHVYVAIVTPAPDSPPRMPRIDKVFASEEDAQAWRIEGPPASVNGTLRHYERHEVSGAAHSHARPE